jgi:hypothetical protein
MIEMYIQMMMCDKIAFAKIPSIYRDSVKVEIERRYKEDELTEDTYNKIKWQ